MCLRTCLLICFPLTLFKLYISLVDQHCDNILCICFFGGDVKQLSLYLLEAKLVDPVTHQVLSKFY